MGMLQNVVRQGVRTEQMRVCWGRGRGLERSWLFGVGKMVQVVEEREKEPEKTGQREEEKP